MAHYQDKTRVGSRYVGGSVRLAEIYWQMGTTRIRDGLVSVMRRITEVAGRRGREKFTDGELWDTCAAVNITGEPWSTNSNIVAGLGVFLGTWDDFC